MNNPTEQPKVLQGKVVVPLQHRWSDVVGHAIVGIALGFTTPIGENSAEVIGSIPFIRNVIPILHGTRPEARLAVFIPTPWVNAHSVEALLKTIENLTASSMVLPDWATHVLGIILGGAHKRRNKNTAPRKPSNND
ncbi:MAG: hypothetical protein WCP97_04945 [bacterium]